ncbi:hypothetical protein [Niallia sp. 03133]|uniref:hypothetical protein n=1 Tax=Niallia sp. 03133 TaxID=3458060 RepID=UPI00404492EB
MDLDRKKIIVKEIVYWKENRMLPAHYCDYLLSLYTAGNQSMEKETNKKIGGLFHILFLLLIPLTTVLLYFTELSFILQIAISQIFLTFCLIGLYFYKKKTKSIDIPVVAAALIVLLTSVYVVLRIFSHDFIFLSIVLLFNCIIWFIAGRKFKLLYFTISSCIGFVLVCSLFFIKMI